MSVFADLCQQTVSAIKNSHRLLSSEADLSPRNDKVTQSLTHLVRTLSGCQCDHLSEYLLTTPELEAERAELPDLCAEAECAMEKFWAQKLIAQTFCELHHFWYMPEYQELCSAEIKLLNGRSFDRISFLGSGALPLTAIFLARHARDSKIVCVDFDGEACDLSEQLIKKIGLSGRIEISHKNAVEYIPTNGELVICASLLQGREAVYKNIESQKGCSMIVRDAEGVYQFLYKPAVLPQRSFMEIAKTMLDSKRINTSRFYLQEEAARYAA